MEKQVIEVPAGIRYISDWKEFRMLEFPHIIDKKIPGCGFTEYCLRNNMNLILVSPRKILLENKEEQHKKEGREILYVKSALSVEMAMDKDISKRPKSGKSKIKLTDEELKRRAKLAKEDYDRISGEIQNYWDTCFNRIPCKILVTYDSYRKVKDILINKGIFQEFYTVVDEFQSIFVDAKFKSTTEMEFVTALQGVSRLCYVSATPMIDSYLAKLDEFKHLPYFELDWETLQPERVSKPDLEVKILRSLSNSAKAIIKKYKDGNFDTATIIDPQTMQQKIVESREAIFYVNSVNNICSIIRNCELLPDDVNILCANTPDNTRRIRTKLGKGFTIGRVPLYDEPRKMFTFCTRTVYLGADFYSDNAKTYILSDANIDSMAVDITLDLPQILGRQRLSINPWKDKADVYVKVIMKNNQQAINEFKEMIDKKIEKTTSLLDSWKDVSTEKRRQDLAEIYQQIAEILNYRDNYVAVNSYNSASLLPVMNDLALISEQRAYDVQQLDYKDRFSVFNSIENQFNIELEREVNNFLLQFNSLEDGFFYKMKYVCENLPGKSIEIQTKIINELPKSYREFYTVIGPDRCRSLGYKYQLLKDSIDQINFDINTLNNTIYNNFQVGEKYSNVTIKTKLQDLYNQLGYKKTAKATDLEQWFELKAIKVKDSSGKRVNGFEIVKKK